MQLEEHPSPSITLPSSHVSPREVSTVPSPHEPPPSGVDEPLDPQPHAVRAIRIRRDAREGKKVEDRSISANSV